jgi:hypothetical protein
MKASWMKRFAEHRAHRHHAVGQALGGGHHVRLDVEVVGRERRRQAAEAGDDFVEDQQDAVLVQISRRRFR